VHSIGIVRNWDARQDPDAFRLLVVTRLPGNLFLPSLRCLSLFPVSGLKKLTLNEVRELSRLSLEAAEGFESLPLRHFRVFPTLDSVVQRHRSPLNGTTSARPSSSSLWTGFLTFGPFLSGFGEAIGEGSFSISLKSGSSVASM